MKPKDIFIARLRLPNDPTGKIKPRQFIVIKNDDNSLSFLSVSSIAHKVRRVYGDLGMKKGINVNAIFNKKEVYEGCGFELPSFVDCTCIYVINEIDQVNIDRLDRREITPEAWKILMSKLNEVYFAGLCEHHIIDVEELKELNVKLKEPVTR